jgi:hypothetical protein
MADSVILSVQHRQARPSNPKSIKRTAEFMANTKSITDKTERKKVKRTARKKAAPKAARTHARGSAKRKVKKMARGQSKR